MKGEHELALGRSVFLPIRIIEPIYHKDLSGSPEPLIRDG